MTTNKASGNSSAVCGMFYYRWENSIPGGMFLDYVSYKYLSRPPCSPFVRIINLVNSTLSIDLRITLVVKKYPTHCWWRGRQACGTSQFSPLGQTSLHIQSVCKPFINQLGFEALGSTMISLAVVLPFVSWRGLYNRRDSLRLMARS